MLFEGFSPSLSFFLVSLLHIIIYKQHSKHPFGDPTKCSHLVKHHPLLEKTLLGHKTGRSEQFHGSSPLKVYKTFSDANPLKGTKGNTEALRDSKNRDAS